MAQRQDKEASSIRTFVKKGPGGETLTRTVTSVPSSEVEARFDGFLPEEEAGFKASTSTTTANKPATSSSS